MEGGRLQRCLAGGTAWCRVQRWHVWEGSGRASGWDEIIVFKWGFLAAAQLAVPQRLIKSSTGCWCLVASPSSPDKHQRNKANPRLLHWQENRVWEVHRLIFVHECVLCAERVKAIVPLCLWGPVLALTLPILESEDILSNTSKV